jgi:hypothetical protein
MGGCSVGPLTASSSSYEIEREGERERLWRIERERERKIGCGGARGSYEEGRERAAGSRAPSSFSINHRFIIPSICERAVS